MTFRSFVSVAIAIALSLFIASAVSAHSTIPRVEISLERLHPGEVVDVRGVSFGMDDTVTLSLIGSGVDVAQGEILADAQGEFKFIAVLPADLTEGTYYFRAVTSHHFVLSPPLNVWGTAITEGGGQGPRDEDDGLLAPMPTYAPGVVPGGIATEPVLQAPDTTPASNMNPFILALAALIAVGIVIGFGMKRKRTR